MSNTRQIAKNTLMLYIRQILIMLVSLYTVRAVLSALGEEDYGIYNVIAGVVVLFSFLNNAMTMATQRYLSCSIGEGDSEKTKKVFKTSFSLHFFISIIVLLLAETIGLWFVATKLNIPIERKEAALWCYQIAIATAVTSIMRIPFHATIIAYEKMEFYAIVSIVEAVLQLIVIFLIQVTFFDALIFYSFLILCVTLLVNLIYFFFCKFNYNTVCFSSKTDYNLIREMSSFSGWTTLTGFADMCKAQGTNIIFNMFHGVTLNAAMGIANQINTAIYQFIANFQTAYTPQVVKSYVSGNKNVFRHLVLQSMKYSFILFSIIAVPFSINAKSIVSIWLKNNEPEYTITFALIILMDSLIGTFIGPLASAMQGIGRIKTYQIVIAIFIFLNLPLSYVLIRFGFSPVYALSIRIVLTFIALIWRLFYLQPYLEFQPVYFLFRTILLGLFLDFISLATGYLVRIWTISISPVLAFFVSCSVSIILVGSLSFTFLLEKPEKKVVFSMKNEKNCTADLDNV